MAGLVDPIDRLNMFKVGAISTQGARQKPQATPAAYGGGIPFGGLTGGHQEGISLPVANKNTLGIANENFSGTMYGGEHNGKENILRNLGIG